MSHFLIAVPVAVLGRGEECTHVCGSHRRTSDVLLYQFLSYSPNKGSLTEPIPMLAANKPQAPRCYLWLWEYTQIC